MGTCNIRDASARPAGNRLSGSGLSTGRYAALAGFARLVVALAVSALLLAAAGLPCGRAYAAETDSAIAKIGDAVAQKSSAMKAEQEAEAASAADAAGTAEGGRETELALQSPIAGIGVAVMRKAAELQAPAPLTTYADYTAHVGTLMQNDLMMGGCELVSLGIVLESMDAPADLDAIVNDYLDIDGSISTGYAGDPYWAGAGFAPGIAAAANGYLESEGCELRAYDLTGVSFDVLADYVDHGYPVLVWTTMGFEDPDFTGLYEGEDEWYSNEHCVVLYGFGEDVALVSDPLEGYVDRDLARFVDIYEQCGSRALVVR